MAPYGYRLSSAFGSHSGFRVKYLVLGLKVQVVGNVSGISLPKTLPTSKRCHPVKTCNHMGLVYSWRFKAASVRRLVRLIANLVTPELVWSHHRPASPCPRAA